MWMRRWRLERSVRAPGYGSGWRLRWPTAAMRARCDCSRPKSLELGAQVTHRCCAPSRSQCALCSTCSRRRHKLDTLFSVDAGRPQNSQWCRSTRSAALYGDSEYVMRERTLFVVALRHSTAPHCTEWSEHAAAVSPRAPTICAHLPLLKTKAHRQACSSSAALEGWTRAEESRPTQRRAHPRNSRTAPSRTVAERSHFLLPHCTCLHSNTHCVLACCAQLVPHSSALCLPTHACLLVRRTPPRTRSSAAPLHCRHPHSHSDGSVSDRSGPRRREGHHAQRARGDQAQRIRVPRTLHGHLGGRAHRETRGALRKEGAKRTHSGERSRHASA